MTAPASTLSDADLVAAHRSGDKTAAGTLCARHDRLIRTVANRSGARDVDDVVGEVRLRIFTHAGTWRDQGRPFSHWVTRVTYNAANDQHRRLRHETPTGVGDSGRIVECRLSGRLDRFVTAVDTASVLGPALAALPVTYRDAVVEVEVHDYDLDTAAQRLGIPAGTVKSRRHRGLARLRDGVEKQLAGSAA